ncbi:hypothetical protein T01_9148 [Trichinella spiralis]|uniref:Uncharacterized protein n=1 Tax=Trichinella spiralis TaxID=6334 RepID=A0A0V1ANI4_TRISP|nr:hypothetical protein T01_9148 [Trichinella spiralis]
MTSLPARVISSLTPLWIRSVGSHEKAVCRQQNKQAVSQSGLLWCDTSSGIPNQEQLAAECLRRSPLPSEVQNTTDGIISIISGPPNSSDSSEMDANEMHKIFTWYHRQCLSLTPSPRLEVRQRLFTIECYERNSNIICHFIKTKETHLMKRPLQRVTYHQRHMILRRLTAADVSAALKTPMKIKTV